MSATLKDIALAKAKRVKGPSQIPSENSKVEAFIKEHLPLRAIFEYQDGATTSAGDILHVDRYSFLVSGEMGASMIYKAALSEIRFDTDVTARLLDWLKTK